MLHRRCIPNMKVLPWVEVNQNHDQSKGGKGRKSVNKMEDAYKIWIAYDDRKLVKKFDWKKGKGSKKFLGGADFPKITLEECSKKDAYKIWRSCHE